MVGATWRQDVRSILSAGLNSWHIDIPFSVHRQKTLTYALSLRNDESISKRSIGRPRVSTYTTSDLDRFSAFISTIEYFHNTLKELACLLQ